MTIRIEPHYRVQILPNVGAAEKDNGLYLYAEVRNIGEETVQSANVVAVAYTVDGTLCDVEESNAYLTLHEGESKAVKLRMDVDPALVDSVRLYTETEYDEEDPYNSEDTLTEPPSFMQSYFHQRMESPKPES
jgi:hypothetical protein